MSTLKVSNALLKSFKVPDEAWEVLKAPPDAKSAECLLGHLRKAKHIRDSFISALGSPSSQLPYV